MGRGYFATKCDCDAEAVSRSELKIDERLHVGGDELVGEQDCCGGEDDQRQRQDSIRCDRVAERECPLSNHVTSFR